MKRLIILTGIILVSINLFAQSKLTLTREAKMRQTNSPLSDVIYIIQVGKQVKTLSLDKNGYYKVDVSLNLIT